MTLRALQAGATFVSGLFLTALVLHFIGNDVAERAASLGVLALIATPALALLATAIERWNRERATALLALTVLAVLGLAVAVAFATP
jgi:fucose permease